MNVIEMAKKHSIARELAAPDFFEGALLGNGNLGVVVCTKPDGITLHLGHNDIWDIRVEEGHKDKIGTFHEVWNKVLSIQGDIYQDEWFRQYMDDVTSSYLKYIYPRPYPASSLHLFFDRKEYEVLGHSLDISNGLLTVTLENTAGEKRYISLFVAQDSDTVCCRTTDEEGRAVPLFCRLRLISTGRLCPCKFIPVEFLEQRHILTHLGSKQSLKLFPEYGFIAGTAIVLYHGCRTGPNAVDQLFRLIATGC
jgi:hypothetical protein